MLIEPVLNVQGVISASLFASLKTNPIWRRLTNFKTHWECSVCFIATKHESYILFCKTENKIVVKETKQKGYSSDFYYFVRTAWEYAWEKIYMNDEVYWDPTTEPMLHVQGVVSPCLFQSLTSKPKWRRSHISRHI